MLEIEVHCSVPQVPRLYDVYKAQGIIENFEQLLDNIFAPLFEVTIDPDTHPQLFLLLQQARLDMVFSVRNKMLYITEFGCQWLACPLKGWWELYVVNPKNVL